MTKERYIKEILNNIQCSRKRKQDIKMQLSAEIEERITAGEKLQDILSEMGNIKEVAESFNENIPDLEKRKYKRKKVTGIGIGICIGIGVIVLILLWSMPKSSDIESSTVFTKTEVEEALVEVIDLLDRDDYAELQANATDQMVKALDEESMKEVKAKICSNFGNRNLIGTIYDQEITQRNVHYAVCQVTVSYENINVTYTVTFDENMKLAGLYMK